MRNRTTTLRMPLAAYHVVGLLATAACVPQACQADEAVSLYRVPSVVRRVAATRAPGLRFTTAVFDEANGYFKLNGRDSRGRAVRVLADEDAELVQVTIYTPVSLRAVPRAVIATHIQTVRQSRDSFFKATTIVRAQQSIATSDTTTVL